MPASKINEYLLLLNEIEPKYLVLSFCESKSQIDNLKKIINQNIEIVPKIETIKAVTKISSICANSKYFMLGRGDLFLDSKYDFYYQQSQIIEYLKKEKDKICFCATHLLNDFSKEDTVSIYDILDIGILKSNGISKFVISGDLSDYSRIENVKKIIEGVS